MIKRIVQAAIVGGVISGVVLARRLKGQPVKRVYPTPESLIINPSALDGRLIPLQGASNFRDLGGYQTTDGRTVRRGLIYRAGLLARLTDADHAKLAELGLKYVCDLRSDQEVRNLPDRLPQGVRHEHLAIFNENESRVGVKALLFRRHELDRVIAESYTDFMLKEKPQVFGAALRRLADPANLPAVFHCTAGKDRTGIVAALLLMLLGVPDETIIADYSLTNLFYPQIRAATEPLADRLKPLRLTIDDLQPLMTADPVNMREMLAFIRREYGGIEGYLTGPAGLEPAILETLRTLFLE